jgi:hypothetical protein
VLAVGGEMVAVPVQAGEGAEVDHAPNMRRPRLRA